MAFTVPSHLPRKKDPQDISTKILTKISDANSKALTAQSASSWVAELDVTLAQTKDRIHERIINDLPSFNEQSQSSKSIQERLHALTDNVDRLSEALFNQESGIKPVILASLAKHAALQQQSLDADVSHDAVSYVIRCQNQYRSMANLVQDGKLPDAVNICEGLEQLLGAVPSFLDQTMIMVDLKRSFRATKALLEEQLSDAYARAVKLSPSDIILRSTVQVRQSENMLPLQSVLSSVSNAALASHLATLRRDIIAHYIDHVLKQPVSVSVTTSSDMTGTPEYRLTLFPDPPNTSGPISRLSALANIFAFLDEHLFNYLPSSERTSFPLSLCKPLRNALLNHLLISFIPSSIALLPEFLRLVNHAREFEYHYICGMLGDANGDKEIQKWADSVGLHYERKRRAEVLEKSRAIATSPEDERMAFYVDLKVFTDHKDELPLAPAQTEGELTEEEPDTAWGFDDGPSSSQDEVPNEENGWDFDDDVEPDPQLQTMANDTKNGDSATSGTAESSGNGWDWNDDPTEDANGDDSYDDDPWADGWNDDPEQKPHANGTSLQPKPATRLEKHVSKGAQVVPNTHYPSIQTSHPGLSSTAPSEAQQSQRTNPAPVKEAYMVSGRAKELLLHVNDILREATELIASGILPSQGLSHVSLGSTISQAAPLTLELFRAIYPVAFNSVLDTVPKRAMRFSNDCLYLSDEMEPILSGLETSMTSIKDKLTECKACLKQLGESWFHETINRQCQSVNELLSQAEGFVETTDQDRFDECENAVNQVLQRIRSLAQQWKAILNRSKYYDAVGAVVDAVLSRILKDILALPDITEAESHRLSELCRIINALEGLFAEDPHQPSLVVAYVPSWLKFSYLSELLEASMADIAYLFEEGALVDFEIDELVKLVRALFADGPLRTNIISKLLRGHPPHS